MLRRVTILGGAVATSAAARTSHLPLCRQRLCWRLLLSGAGWGNLAAHPWQTGTDLLDCKSAARMLSSRLFVRLPLVSGAPLGSLFCLPEESEASRCVTVSTTAKIILKALANSHFLSRYSPALHCLSHAPAAQLAGSKTSS